MADKQYRIIVSRRKKEITQLVLRLVLYLLKIFKEILDLVN